MTHRPLAALGAAALIAGLAVPALAAPPRDFLNTAVEGDNAEIALGKLAQSRASDPKVRDFANMLVQDHSMHLDMIRPLAQSKGVRDMEAMEPAARAERGRLEGLNGKAFDHEFVRFMIKDHRHAITAYEAEAHGNGPAADMARQTLPTLHKHLEAAEHLAGG